MAGFRSAGHKCNLLHSLPNLGNIFNILFETLKKHVTCKILTFIRSTNTSNFYIMQLQ